MEKVDEDEEKTIVEASNLVEATGSGKEDESIKGKIAEQFDPVNHIEEGSMDPSNSQTVEATHIGGTGDIFEPVLQTVTFEDHDVSDYEMEDEKVLELFRRNSGLRPEVTERNNFSDLNMSEEMLLEFQESKPTSAFNEDTEDSSSNSDLDSNLSKYYFDGSLPVSSHVEVSETHQDENEMPLLCPKQPEQQLTSWRNCCGLLALLRAPNP